ncbi:uncharacterized protein LOC110010386 [Jatropha curcas]|uniref:uncharacterized protein LOC110010386 n=1 Tax=Jatropha curcas TaxID=180498 RepID=UPI00189557B8|nr:uncharacterized protein LOC110010386 [Jatropha curcas]
MEMCIARAKIEEAEEITMSRFLRGLNSEIADALEMCHYDTLEEMVDMAMKLERQKKGKFTNRYSNNTLGSNWSKGGERRDFRDNSFQRAESTSRGKEVAQSSFKGNKDTSNPITPFREIKCFKCLGKRHITSPGPNKRVMISKDDGNISFESECSDSNDVPHLHDDDNDILDVDEHNLLFAEHGESLIVRRALNMHVKEESLEQRENIFHTRCLVNGKVCILIINRG